ncbi:hypothetical protein [Deinococcus sp. QL22]|nr:hypothetical protein [Deinococcus sp. QL22]UQN09277.1 hypothetical protein M1R55_22140 [Deinococcus sp. QL22]
MSESLAVPEIGLESVLNLWIRPADGLPGECLIITRQHAHFLGRVLEAV